jgi:hypothetical protein
LRRLSPHYAITTAVVLIGLVLFAIAPYALLVMAPALALAWLVAIGALTGEEAVRWVRRVAARLRPRRPSALRPARRAPARRPLRGGLLIAAALASRPPPHTA